MSDKTPEPVDDGTTAKLTQGSIGRHLVAQTTPMVIGVAALMSIGLVDSYFIGQLGSAELAAIGFIFPVSVALASLGVGVMVGINSVVARALGAGNTEQAARRANFGIAFSVGIGLMLGIGLFFCIDPLFRLMNADEAMMPIIRTYMRPFALGFPLQLAIMGLGGVLRGQGEARRTSVISVSYAAANWILDPILITGAFGFAGLGIVGAAYATIIGWAVGVIVGVLLMRNTAMPVDLRKLRNCDLVDPAKAILRVAGPASFSNAVNPIGLSVLTALVAAESTTAVAGFGAAGRLQSFAVVPLLALSGSIGAIVGQNWGAGHLTRAKRAAMMAGGFCLAYGLLTALALYVWRTSFGALFSDDAAVIDEFALYLTIAVWGYAGYGLLIVGNGILNAVDRAGWALVQSCLRVFAVMLPIAWALRASMGSGAIYTAELVANLAGGALAATLVWLMFARARRKQTAAESG